MYRAAALFLLSLAALPASAGSENLDQWLERDLVPYVNSQLGSMPRFREESFRFVVMDDGNPVSEATALAMKVRDTIRDAARDVPGIRIAWPGDNGALWALL